MNTRRLLGAAGAALLIMVGSAGVAEADTQVVGYTNCPGGAVVIAYYGVGRFEIGYGAPGAVFTVAHSDRSYYTYGYVKTFRPVVNWYVQATRLNDVVPGDVRPDMTYAYCE